MTLRWAHAVMYVRDMEEMLDFYTNVLEFEVADRGPVLGDKGPEIVFLSQVETDHHQLAFLATRQDQEPSNSLNHLAFRTESLDDVKKMIHKLEKDGRATNMNPMTHGNAWSIYFQDPENNGVEVFCDTPFHVNQPQGKPWNPAMDEAELTEWTKGEFSGEREFLPIGDYYQARAEHLAKRKPE